MARRFLSPVLAFTIALSLLIGRSQAQDSTDPLAAAPEATTPKTEAKTSSRTTPKSPEDQDHASPSSSTPKAKSQQATFGAGCFWHVEDVFERLPGVNWAVSGYAGGDVAYPSYEMVHEGATGHAEVVMVDYDPTVISYEKLLNVFWRSHDPTTLNRQGPDVGTQYRSVIFYHNEDQRKAALKSYRELTGARAFRSPIVTQLFPMKAFYRAEDYHQDYYGGKPRAITRRRKATVAKAKKPAAKAARSSTPTSKAVSEPPVSETSDASPGAQP